MIDRIRRAPLMWFLLLAALAATACTSGEAPRVTAPTVESAVQQSPSVIENPLLAEIARWEAKVAAEPTADNWSELSYANIKAERWEAAAKAGGEALKQKSDHPYALYNTGLALVRLNKAMAALPLLKQTAAQQPDRYEPQMALAEAYQQLGHYLLASHYARGAVGLAKGDPAALRAERAVADMLTLKPPADLDTACVQRVTDGGFFLCLYEEPAPQRTVDSVASAYSGKRYTLWYGPAGQAPRPISVGYTTAGKLETVALPGGATGYWLPGGYVGAGVAGTREWRLFVREGNGLRQMLFLGGDNYEGGMVSDYMRSPSVPTVKGDEIVTSHRDDVTGSRSIRTRRRISLAEGTVTAVMEEEIIRGPLTQVTPMVEVESGFNYKWSYPVAEDARVSLNLQPAKLADLKIGMYATITVVGGRITQIDAKP
ncbi:MAG TPA: hypothetical protein VNT26_02565 [Candidatus Sulfotelmatobacter sp.]|nr:hypothetical protein [Candidatus Sulfotelmatobacter sp.]